jgi:hypothetical protein
MSLVEHGGRSEVEIDLDGAGSRDFWEPVPGIRSMAKSGFPDSGVDAVVDCRLSRLQADRQ